MLSRVADALLGAPCAHCGKRTAEDHATTLADNLARHGIAGEFGHKAMRTCERCMAARCYARCVVTNQVFLRKDDRLVRFLGRATPILMPYHALSKLSGYLSPAGEQRCLRELDQVVERYEAWVGGSKQDWIAGHDVVERLGQVRSDEPSDDIAGVEKRLRLFSAQVGGNAFIRFHWERHVDFSEERYLAGHGPNGNPYFRTRQLKIVRYSGHAVAVTVVRSAPRSKHKPGEDRRCENEQTGRPAPGETMNERVRRFRLVLGVAQDYTREELTAAYRERIKEYHPDRVHGLGAELRALAERKTKEINEAYCGLKQKFS